MFVNVGTIKYALEHVATEENHCVNIANNKVQVGTFQLRVDSNLSGVGKPS